MGEEIRNIFGKRILAITQGLALHNKLLYCENIGIHENSHAQSNRILSTLRS